MSHLKCPLVPEMSFIARVLRLRHTADGDERGVFETCGRSEEASRELRQVVTCERRTKDSADCFKAGKDCDAKIDVSTDNGHSVSVLNEMLFNHSRR